MYSAKALDRVRLIEKKVAFIENIVVEYGTISLALEDEQNGRASISEQFDKLLHSGELELLSSFEKEDIKGSYDLRNFIAHHYEGVDLYVVEDVIRERLPVIKTSVEKILKGN